MSPSLRRARAEALDGLRRLAELQALIRGDVDALDAALTSAEQEARKKWQPSDAERAHTEDG